MKDIIITIALIVLAFFYTAEIEISFSPFKVSFNDLFKGIGIVLLFLSIFFLQTSAF